MKNTLLMVSYAAAILVSGCSTLHKSDSARLQGTWVGQGGQANSAVACSFVVAGNTFAFRDEANTNIWYKGTFSLREDTMPRQFVAAIKDCPFPKYVGKTSMAIYRIENRVLTITGNEPGKTEVPAAFDAPGAARLELKRK